MSSSSSRIQTAAASIAATASILGALFYLDILSWGPQKIAARRITSRCYSEDSTPSLTAFKALTEQVTTKETYPLATAIEQNIPIYDGKSINLNDEEKVKALQDEIYHILTSGPVVFVLQNFFTDLNTLSQANSAYKSIITSEVASNGSKGDHFATAGTNSRIWNSFSKHCLTNPSHFLQYFSNPWFQIICESYLGPAYRITSQVNIVRPGGKAQVSHGDYHLGFQPAEQCAKWPKGIHNVSALLTLLLLMLWRRCVACWLLPSLCNSMCPTPVPHGFTRRDDDLEERKARQLCSVTSKVPDVESAGLPRGFGGALKGTTCHTSQGMCPQSSLVRALLSYTWPPEFGSRWRLRGNWASYESSRRNSTLPPGQ